MSAEENIIKQIIILESKYNLSDVYIGNVPLWHILRYTLRQYYIRENGFKNMLQGHNKKSLSVSRKIKYNFVSFLQIVRLLTVKNKKQICFFGFTRLELFNGMYIDKFLDPLIQESQLKSSDYLYFDNEYAGHSTPRNQEHDIMYTDFINSVSLIFSLLIFPYVYLKNLRAYKKIVSFTKYATTDKKALLYIYIKSCQTIVQCSIYKKIFKTLEIKTIVGVSRITYRPQALAAKQLGIKVVEIQHGITQGITSLYSGNIEPKIDPDVFCTFGNYCPLDVFGIDKSKIVNIGWAFKDYIKRKVTVSENIKNAVLVISEPAISDLLLSFVALLARNYPTIEFHLRRHPQETYSDEQIEIIHSFQNVMDVSSSQCSQIVILSYEYILGENSSVLYEALSVGKKVARINCCGLHAIGFKDNLSDGFYYINHTEDFLDFMTNFNNGTTEYKIYSDFNSGLFKTLL